MIKNLINKENTVKGATIILIVTLMLSNVLGVLRDHYLAQKIPTSLLDTYYAAFRIPDLVFNVIILGAVSSAFIPVFSRFINHEDNDEASKLASSVFTVGSVIVIVSVILLFLFMPLLTPLLVPSFSPEKQKLTLQLSRLMLLSPIFFGLSYFLGAILNSYKRFFVSSLAPLVYNLSIIIATICFGDKYGTLAVAYGVVVGAFFHMLIQVFPVKNLNLNIRFMWDTSSKSVREVGRLMVPRAIGLGAAQILLFGFTAIASGIGGGAVAIFSLADNIQTLPTVVFGNSLALALFPTLAQAYSRGQKKEFIGYLEKAVVSILFFLIPASIAFILLRIQIVRLVFGSGNFGWSQTTMTAQALGFFSLSLLFSGLTPLFARSFYAINNTRLPMYYSIAGVVVSILLGYVLGNYMGVAGLALAFSVGSFTNFILLYFGFRQAMPEFKSISIFDNVYKIIIATIIMGISIQLTKTMIGTIYDLSRSLEVLVQAGLAIIVGGVVYLLSTYAMGFRDFGKLNRIIYIFKRNYKSNEER
jgi:putative peptidoglycan lipid II flippase